jgi:glycosyltransferase involved in cell wall biosynthesis
VKRIVLSGVNLVEAGPLSVYKDALSELSRGFSGRYEIIALVNKAGLFDTTGVTYLEFPAVKRSWLRRLKFEYLDCRSLSRQLDAHLWLAMHDMSPNVKADIQAVYYHNPAPFYRLTLREAFIDWRFAMFCLFYHLLYAFNIRKNDFFIVQQQWLRETIHKQYPALRVVVAQPSPPLSDHLPAHIPADDGRVRFFYPALPRVFKNMEVILQACALLEEQGTMAFEVTLTVSGTENPYARMLWQKYGHLSMVRWLGVLPRSRVEELYREADCLIFPSKLETWGLPISEFKQTGRPILLADLPYAHETLGSYQAALFFPPRDAHALARQMAAVASGEANFHPIESPLIPPPFTKNWQQLFQVLLGEKVVDARETGDAVQ